MTSMIDFSVLDDRAVLDFAIMVEEDAQLRYEQMARLIGDDPGGAGRVCRMMAVNERKHRRQLETRRDALFRADSPRIEISVVSCSVERPDFDDDALPGTARAALEIALAAERRSQAFYRDAAPRATDAGARALFEEFMREEAEHAALLTKKIAALEAMAPHGTDPMPVAAAATPAAPGEAYPDAVLLASILPRFDAATQAVAKGVIVGGMTPDDVASALGVTRRTVVRKLTRFVDIARQHLALAVAAAALSGCAGGMDLPDGSARAFSERADDRPTSTAALTQPYGQGAAPEVRTDGYSQGGWAQPGTARVADTGGAPAAVDPFSRTPPAAQVQSDGTQLRPEFAHVSPESGSAEGGYEVLITGSGFSNVQVMFGSVAARVTSQSSNAITVIAPGGQPGPLSVVVTNRDGAYAVAGGAHVYQI